MEYAAVPIGVIPGMIAAAFREVAASLRGSHFGIDDAAIAFLWLVLEAEADAMENGTRSLSPEGVWQLFTAPST